MKLAAIALTAALAVSLVSCGWEIGTGLAGSGNDSLRRIVDHRDATIAGFSGLSAARVRAAKIKLNIAYWHTSHGSQLSAGMVNMDTFYGGTGLYTVNVPDGLVYHDNSGFDLGSCDYETITRTWLGAHSDTNIIMWSWCGQVSDSNEGSIDDYLSKMTHLETDFPGVRFVYMTGHADGTGLEGNLHIRNQQIRDYCIQNNKFLYDFYDIECYDPDGVYYGDRHVADSCNYDGGNNWATAWQTAHSTLYWPSGSEHSQPLNANQKAKAAWQLFARLAESLPRTSDG